MSGRETWLTQKLTHTALGTIYVHASIKAGGVHYIDFSLSENESDTAMAWTLESVRQAINALIDQIEHPLSLPADGVPWESDHPIIDEDGFTRPRTNTRAVPMHGGDE